MTRLDPAQFNQTKVKQESPKKRQQQQAREETSPMKPSYPTEDQSTLKEMPAFSLPRTLLAKHLKEKAARKTDLGMLIMRELKRRSEERAAIKKVIVERLAQRQSEVKPSEEINMEENDQERSDKANDGDATTTSNPVVPPIVYPILLDLAARQFREKLANAVSTNDAKRDDEDNVEKDAPLDLSVRPEKASDFSIHRLVEK